jgi:UDP-N-acetylmuramoyl-L-alanyl-D-glutamate--2,6-diaminopimelate ligase
VITQSSGTGAASFEAAHQVLDGFNEPKSARPIPNRFRAIEWVLENAAEEDAVLIAGLGDRPIATVGVGAWPVTDRDVCQAWLYDRHSFCGEPEGESRKRTFRIEDYRRNEEN